MNGLRATIRLQLHAGFTLDDAAARVPYFARLGLSHVYASPILTARPGSMHGYDTLDYGRVNPELGGRDALCRLVACLRAHAMGLIVDIVPNHMAIGGAGNRWWEDVLAWGRNSVHAHYFDIDWDAFAPWLHGRILAPFLDRSYGAALRDGMLRLAHEAQTGMFFVHHHEHRFPVCPRHYAALLADVGAPADLCAELGALTPAGGGCRGDVPALSRLAAWGATADGQAAIARIMERHDTRTACGRSALHELLGRQSFRLAWWRTTPDLINWRRFFDITGLAALCVEHEDVFDAVHGHILDLYADGLIDGVRVDHVDGLTEPAAYCLRLRQRLMAVQHLRPATAPQHLSIHVEKILHEREHLPPSWQVDGTTGYDFMDQVSAMLHDPDGTALLDGLWRDHAIADPTFADTERNARALVLHEVFPAELSGLRTLLAVIAQCSADTCDYSVGRIGAVLSALLMEFHFYRTYFSDDAQGGYQADHAVLKAAAHGAKAHLLPSCHDMLDWVVGILGRTGTRDAPIHEAQRRFEHLTAPLAAKAVEDTSFYRYGRLLSRNEVGSDPGKMALPVARFHKDNLYRHKAYPDTLLATATHDHKRGEDARMRLAVLSEVAARWHDLVNRWIVRNAHLRRRRMTPDRADEMILYQAMLGAWPLVPWPDADARQEFHDRIVAWQTKALREAKRHTSWTDPDMEYEDGCREFTRRLLDPRASGPFIADMDMIVATIAPAAALNSLAQLLLRLALPGVADLYQGTELWDFSLVDPDNRRPVDFTLRQTMLQQDTSLHQQAAQWRTGGVKMYLLQKVLAFRAQYPLVFSKGSYEPVEVSGAAEKHVIAFVRRYDGIALLVVVVRHAWGLVPSPHDLSLDMSLLEQTYLSFKVSGNGTWSSIVHEGRMHAPATRLALSFLQGGVPVDCLVQI
ncbi:malto-oligosyltrehalose synthase [Gluconacetobacter entanii]|uniref:malto-oligosyltrehalose synthase n=1 Tax=Gluconacetobacter entanii TaxID=108528 RepID=UPI001C9342D0|nr:malto-oligosyltrehalose synthase [Gluconacetobacter entanii]MBY4641671.1 malto-oligosyltrehalose synthase [Gluconacetobacter entanii]MCW4581142.1 malto-oligosyltrehalose synthase [Gluconacetobacter entanii]MCW4584402.1 malto-oligosyltrehalose synthase [Gluconacetobacter entanii]MCW4587816.1 malto-oligosyltrehalose synthase [Gluconacetobacter entanii]